MFSHFVKLLFIASMASYQVNAATTAAASSDVYLIDGNVEVTFTITVETGTFTITYGSDGSMATVGTVDVDASTFSDGGSPVADFVVDVTVATEIKVTKSNLESADNGKLIKLAYDDGSVDTSDDTDHDKDFTISLSCPAITGASGDNINVESSDTGNGCTPTNYQFEGCVTVFNCVAGYYVAADVSSTCTAGQWSATLPTCTAITCDTLTVTGATVTCTNTNKKGSSCTVACDAGKFLTAGTSPVTCDDSQPDSTTGVWSDTTAHVCTALITVSASPTTYFLGDDVTISAVILDAVPDGDYTISWGEDTVSTVTIASDNSLSEQAADPEVANVTVEVSGSTINVKKTSLVEADDGKVVKFDHASGNDNDKSFTLDISTTPCVKIPNPANGTSTCATTLTQVGSNCTITCNEGTKLSGSSPVKCEAGSGLTGKWSNTTDTYSCDAISGAGMIALNMMLALVLGAISSFMM